jgi:hypothetical protein
MFSVETSSTSGGEYLSYITGTQCLEEVNGETIGTGSACGSGGGGGTWGSITGTLSNQTDLQTVINNIGSSTATIQTQVNSKVNLSSFTATQPILYNNATGVFSATAISLSTGVMSSLPAASIASGSLGSSVIASSLAINSGSLTAGTNITSITGNWPNLTINAATQSGGGGASSLGMGLGTVAGLTVLTSSPTALAFANSSQFTASALGSATYYFALNPSSVTLQGAIVSSITLASMYGAPTLTGTNFTSLPGAQVGSGVPAPNIASGSLGANVIASSITLAAMYGSPTLNGANITNIQGTQVGSGVPAANIASGSLGASVIASSLTASGVTAGSYTSTNLTVNAEGQITSASNGSSSGFELQGGGGSPFLTSSATFVAGTNITLSQTGSSITITSSGGSGSPGGSNQQIQYNNAGAFGGDQYFNVGPTSATLTEPVVIASTFNANVMCVSSDPINQGCIVSVSSTPAQAPGDYLMSVSSAGNNFVWGVQNNSLVQMTDAGNTFTQFVSTQLYISASTSTTVGTLQVLPGMGFQIGANEIWWYKCLMMAVGATGGAKFGINGPSGATVQATVYGATSASAFTDTPITTLNTANGTACLSAAAADMCIIEGTMANSTTAGSWTLQREAANTSDTVTLNAGSYCTAQRIQ